MRLQKIQKLLKENNIDYKYSSEKYGNSEFGTIDIKDDRTGFYTITEICGNRGSSPSGIMAFYKSLETGIKEKYSTLNQTEIIKRIENEVKK